MNSTQVRWLIVFVLLLALGAYAYGLLQARSSQLRVRFINPKGEKSVVFDLDIAADEASRTKGLMFRKPSEISERGGMIFIFPQEQVQKFWMKNTYTSLDMIFVSRDLKVVGIVPEVPILSENTSSVSQPSKYVIELHAGTAKRFGITEGVLLDPLEPLPQAH